MYQFATLLLIITLCMLWVSISLAVLFNSQQKDNLKWFYQFFGSAIFIGLITFALPQIRLVETSQHMLEQKFDFMLDFNRKMRTLIIPIFYLLIASIWAVFSKVELDKISHRIIFFHYLASGLSSIIFVVLIINPINDAIAKRYYSYGDISSWYNIVNINQVVTCCLIVFGVAQLILILFVVLRFVKWIRQR